MFVPVVDGVVDCAICFGIPELLAVGEFGLAMHCCLRRTFYFFIALGWPFVVLFYELAKQSWLNIPLGSVEPELIGAIWLAAYKAIFEGL